MKHYLNFKPVIIYRKGSRFMLNNSLAIIYLLPVMLLSFYGYNYYSFHQINEFYNAHYNDLRSAASSYQRQSRQNEPDREKLKEYEKFYFNYRKVSAATRASWGLLFNHIERILPSGVRLTRLRLRPDKFINIEMEGEAIEFKEVTLFLSSLFNDTSFINPQIRRHRKIDEDGMVSFTMNVQYIPERPQLP